MHQIDIMVNNKKREWEKKLQALEARMTVRDQELASAQSRLDQKGLEVWDAYCFVNEALTRRYYLIARFINIHVQCTYQQL